MIDFEAKAGQITVTKEWSHRLMSITVRGAPGVGKSKYVDLLARALLAEGFGVIVEDNGDPPKVKGDSSLKNKRIVYIFATNEA